MLKPRALRPGDRIEMVSPASPVDAEKVQRAKGLLEAEGYRVTFGAHAFDRTDYLAGTDEDRASDLQAAFEDQDVAAVLCTRGGYGAARLLPSLDVAAMAASRKLFLGFSDISTLHLALNAQGLATVHAPMALSLSVDREPWVVESFKEVLKGGDPIAEGAPRGETVVGGRGRGAVTGGCLCLLTDSLATRFPLDPGGKILLIEDVDENPHRIDAMLTHLLNSGLVQRAAGIVVGEMTRSDDMVDVSIGRRPWKEIVTERLAPLGIPMVVGYPFGHCPNMLSLPLGIGAELDADAGTLRYVESLCGS